MPTLNFSGLLAILTGGVVLVLSFAQPQVPEASSSVGTDTSVAAPAAGGAVDTARHDTAASPRSRGA